jgi:hypothetical protein
MSPDRGSLGVDPAMLAGLGHHLGVALVPARIVRTAGQGRHEIDRDKRIALVEQRDPFQPCVSGRAPACSTSLNLRKSIGSVSRTMLPSKHSMITTPLPRAMPG